MELMDRRSLGLSGVDVSRVGLGGYELGQSRARSRRSIERYA
jgi:aryl-alcohol dehydrogenase-like predicted oxidoreductase